MKWRRHRGGLIEEGEQRPAGVGQVGLKVGTSRVQEVVASRACHENQHRHFLQSQGAV